MVDARCSLVLGKVYKKYKCAKKALEVGQGFDKPVRREKIPYPTGQTPGRGDFDLSEYLEEASDISKEDYNCFIVCNFTPLESTR